MATSTSQQRPLQNVCANEAALLSALATKGLKVLEIYPSWCGPCRSVVSALRSARLARDDEYAITFLAVAAEACEQLEPVRERQGSSEPAFLFYRVRL